MSAPLEPSVGRLPALDGCRALAATGVVVFHVLWIAGDRTSEAALIWGRLGNLGVCLFFVLSGFLLLRPRVAAALDQGPGPHLAAYAHTRVCRVVPAYWLVLLVHLFILGLGGARSVGDTATFFLFAQVYRDGLALQGLPVAWTLCIEVAFYAVVPLLGLVLNRVAAGERSALAAAQRLLLVAAALYGLAVLYRVWVLWAGVPWPNPLLWLPAYLDWFAIGLALAVLGEARQRGMAIGTRTAGLASDVGGCLVLALALYLVSTQLGLRPSLSPDAAKAQTMWRFLLNGAISGLLLLPVVLAAASRSVWLALLASAPLRAVGRVSYGIYLWHMVWVLQLREWTGASFNDLDTWMIAVAIGGLTAASALLSWIVVEEPVLRWSRGRRDRTREAVPSARRATS